MCDDHELHGGTDTIPPDAHVGRRGFLAGAAASVAALGLGLRNRWISPAAASTRIVNDIGQRPWSLALHVHSSFSEGTGSMQAQLAEAARSGVDGLWWTDHDWRMGAIAYRRAVHFDSLDAEKEAGQPWKWTSTVVGKAAVHEGAIVSDPVSPLDPSPTPGALYVRAVSSTAAEASQRFFGDETASRLNARSNVRGLKVTLEVFPTSTSTDAWLEMLVTISYRPVQGAKPKGVYSLSYRFGPGPQRREVRGVLGIVWLPVPNGAWSTVTVTPEEDIAALWPDILAADNTFGRLWLGATSRAGADARGCFDYLRFERTQVGETMLATQRELMAAYGARFPTVTQFQGLEVSYFHEHVNWYGGHVQIPDYTGWTDAAPHEKSADRYLRVASEVAAIHAGGGLASLNHPYGTGFGLQSQTAVAAQRRDIVKRLLAARAGLDILEVGYQQRGADLRGHLDLWDTLLRNGLFLTGTGVSDDHEGEVNQWTKGKNRFATGTWASALDEASMVGALAGGRAYCRELGSFDGTIDITMGTARMGQVLLQPPDSTTTADIAVTGVPPGGGVTLVQGAVEPGPTVLLDPASTVIATASAGDLAGGHWQVPVGTLGSTFVRAEVHDSTGRCVGLSNPVWILSQPPAGGVPLARVAAA
jgi:hypothetical protein